MNAQTDQQLLRIYVASRSEPAFAELVRRHLDLVYSAALRRIGDPHLAQDVTQGTFVALTQNARALTNHPVLSGWLHRTTQNIATNLIRTSARRHAREQEAVTMNQLLSTPSSAASWHDIAPHLDTALDELDASDRDAVLLRYFEKKSAHEMAAQLGISAEAAQKRVSRAVEKLREFFAKRGVTVGASGLAVVISANAVQAAPVGLALTISTAAALTGTTLATTATVTATKAIAMTALQKIVVAATIAGLTGFGIYETRQSSELRNQARTLQEQQSKHIQQLQSERDNATNQISALRGEIERLNQNSVELLKLRGEIGVLRSLARAQSSEMAASNAMTKEVEFWLARVERLKQKLRDDPGLQFPELQFMNERAWMFASQLLNTDSPQDYLNAARSAQGCAKQNFGNELHTAILKYNAENNQPFPPNFSALQPYLPNLSDASVFDRYEITAATLVTEISADSKSATQRYRVTDQAALGNNQSKLEWVVIEKSPMYKEDAQLVVSVARSQLQRFEP